MSKENQGCQANPEPEAASSSSPKPAPLQSGSKFEAREHSPVRLTGDDIEQMDAWRDWAWQNGHTRLNQDLLGWWLAGQRMITECANLSASLLSAKARIQALEEALTPPDVWSETERDGMAAAFAKASDKHGHYESLFAAAAFILRHRFSLTQKPSLEEQAKRSASSHE